ncbi:phosphoglycerate kinase [candidate division KSB1 bacterium]
MKRLSIDDLELKGKRVLMRVDFNVPLDENQRITDDTRIRASLPTIKKIVSEGGRAVLMSHLGRPKGQVKPEMSLRPAALRLGELLEQEVKIAPDCIGPDTEKIVSKLNDGDCVLLENVRFHSEETDNEREFAKKLSVLGDVYVNDAFGSAHRAHASTAGVCEFIEQKAAGYLMEKEIKFLGGALENPKSPFIAVMGGAKISGKIDLIKNFLDKVDAIIIGGGMAMTFFKAQGKEIGKSICEDDKLDLAREILDMAKAKNTDFLLPVDAVVADKFDNEAEKQEVDADGIPSDWMMLDIGANSIKAFSEEINKAEMILWNGPMGVFEMNNFESGTKAVAEEIASATDKGTVSIVGGGDSVAALKKFGLTDKMTHVSTGGGASLEMLEGKILPGIKALEIE